MLTYISASKIYPVADQAIDDGVLALDENGEIAGLYTAAAAQKLDIEPLVKYKGAIVPGFINSHCHLELSHLKGKIVEHTGLLGFVAEVMKNRNQDQQSIVAAMEVANREMEENGIVAVADISNLGISRQVKLDAGIYYHTLIEAMGFNPDKADDIMQQAIALKKEFAPLKTSIVPHAPYSVSDALLAAIQAFSLEEENLISIHNQETLAEQEFFSKKTGGFLDLYRFLGLDLSFYTAPGTSSLQATLAKLPKGKTLLVHNTTTDAADIAYAKNMHENLYWCLCPNANLYIENTLPDVGLLSASGLKICLGTDSLASNHQLSILKEMQTLQNRKQVKFEDLLQWATLNGAEFLGIAQQYGSLTVGKSPGILLLENMDGENIVNQTRIRRLI